MPDTLAVIGIALAAITLAGVAVALVLWRRSEHVPAAPAPVCPRCAHHLPAGALHCPDCAQTPPPVPLSPEPTSRPALVGFDGSLAGQAFLIAAAPRGLTIGRHPDNDIVIRDVLAVSRQHAQVVPEGDDIVLYDRDSANGTVVNGVRVFRHVLADGDVVQICGVRLGFSRSGVWDGDRSGAAIEQGALGGGPGPAEEAWGLGASDKAPGFSAHGEAREAEAGPSRRRHGRELGTPHRAADELPVAPAPAAPLHPERIDGCVIDEVLGRGGMSVVYRGHDEAGQTVAIKVLNVSDDYIVRKFVQEHEIGEMLGRHPYIRLVQRLGQDPKGNLFLVMEYVEGHSLRRMIGRLTEVEIVRIIGQSCLALAYAHERNIIHRDIKPENILIDAQGHVKLTDFGIAKLTSSVTLTTDRVVGTPEYLSPEQAKGEERVGPASDIYSLGVVLYELLVGRVPFPLPRDEGAFHAAVTVLRHHIHTPPPSLRSQKRGVSRRLEKVALRALEKNPKKRYSTADEMCEALGYHEAPPSIADEASGGSILRTGAYRLLIVSGAGRGREIIVPGQGLTIGRADLDPADVNISRRHAVLLVRGDQLWLDDISLNGTWINGERVFGQARLRPGDRVQVGRSVVMLSTASPTVA